MVEFLSFRDGEAAQEPAVTVESFTGQSNATAVRIEPGEDARELLPHLDRLSLVEVNFPAYGDGRGYSAARWRLTHAYVRSGHQPGAGVCLAGARGRGDLRLLTQWPWRPARLSRRRGDCLFATHNFPHRPSDALPASPPNDQALS